MAPLSSAWENVMKSAAMASRDPEMPFQSAFREKSAVGVVGGALQNRTQLLRIRIAKLSRINLFAADFRPFFCHNRKAEYGYGFEPTCGMLSVKQLAAQVDSK